MILIIMTLSSSGQKKRRSSIQKKKVVSISADIIEQERTLYRKNDLTALLRMGVLESLALHSESLQAGVYTWSASASVSAQWSTSAALNDQTEPNNLTNVLGGEGTDQGGYVLSQELKRAGKFPNTDPDDHSWVPTGLVFYSLSSDDTSNQELDFASEHFFSTASLSRSIWQEHSSLPMIAMKPRSHRKIITSFWFEIYDPVDNSVLAQSTTIGCYNLVIITDPNHNRTEVAFDALGMVAGTAVKGKDDSVGDTLSGVGVSKFEPDLTQAEVDEFYDVSDPSRTCPEFSKGGYNAHHL